MWDRNFKMWIQGSSPGQAKRPKCLLNIVVLLILLKVESNAQRPNLNNVGFFWHVDSIHLDKNFTLEGDRNHFCWARGNPAQGSLRGRSSAFPPLGPYGDYLCDSPSHLVTSAMRFMREKMGDEADFILWTGNTVPQNPRFPPEQKLRLLAHASEMFRLHFPYTTVYPALGNLDVFPPSEYENLGVGVGGFGGGRGRGVRGRATTTGHKLRRRKKKNRMLEKEHEFRNGSASTTLPSSTSGSSSTSGLDDLENFYHRRAKSPAKKTLDALTKIWYTWLPPKAIDSFQKGGYYTIELAKRKLRLISLNTNLYLSTSLRERYSYDLDTEASWMWLHNVMDQAKSKGQNVLIFGHTPPGKFERDYSSTENHWLEHRFNRRYVHFVRTYADIIVGQFFGHQHSDSFRLFKDDRGRTVSWALLSPSLSPYKRSVQVGQESFSTNPAVRLYRYDKNTGEIFDYAQYYLNLRAANSASSGQKGRNSAAQWRLEYNFTTHYGLNHRTVNPSSLDTLADKLSKNKTWFNSYFRANAVNHPGPWSCDDKCRQVQTCSIANVDYDDYQMCVSQAKALSTSSGEKCQLNFGLLLLVVALVARK